MSQQFVDEFRCSGPRTPQKDDDGEEIYQLYTILNKCTKDGVTCLEVQYWEPEHLPGADEDEIFVIPLSDLKLLYPKQVKHWEDKFGRRWAKEYPHGRQWKAPQTSQKSKRQFDDTPEKSRRSPKKKKDGDDVASGEDSEEDSEEESNDSDDDEGKQPTKKDPFVDTKPASPGKTPASRMLMLITQPIATLAHRFLSRTSSADSQSQDQDLSSDSIDEESSIAGPSRVPRLVIPDSEGEDSNVEGTNDGKLADEVEADMDEDEIEDPNDGQRTDGMEDDVLGGEQDEVEGSNDGPGVEDEDSEIEANHSIIEISDDDSLTDHQITDIFGGSKAAYAESLAELDEDDEEPSPQPTQTRDASGESVYDSMSSKFIEALDNGVYALLNAVLQVKGMPDDDWITKRKESKECKWEDFRYTLWMMLQTWDPLILKHFTHGNLPKEVISNPDLERELRRLRNITAPEKKKACPCTYAQYLVHKTTGESPSPKILHEILDSAELYLKGFNGIDPLSHQLASEVDAQFGTTNWGRNTALRGERRYIESATQLGKCQEWIANTRERLDGLDDDEPLARPLVEVGYATFPGDRLNEHAKHTSSNYLMNLTDAICRFKHPNFVIRQFVVHHLIHEHYAMYDEIIASRISLAYITQGGGFCHFPAGRSHGGIEKISGSYFQALQIQLSSRNGWKARVAAELNQMQENTELLQEFCDTEDLSAAVMELEDMNTSLKRMVDKIEEEKKELEGLNDMLGVFTKAMEYNFEDDEDEHESGAESGDSNDDEL